MRHQADVVRKLHRALRDARKHRQREEIHLARVGLAADGIDVGEAHLLRDERFELFDLLPVAVEQREEARRGAGRAAASEELEVPCREIQLLKIEHQILHPQRRALAERRRLGGLKMRISQRRQRLVLLRKIRKRGDRAQKPRAYLRESLPLKNDVRVVADIAARRAEMDYRHRLRAGRAEGMDMRHNVVAQLALLLRRKLIVDVGQVCAHLVKLFVGDVQPQLLLALREREPQSAPGRKLIVGREYLLHFFTRVAAAKGAFIAVGHAVFLRSYRIQAKSKTSIGEGRALPMDAVVHGRNITMRIVICQ